MSRLHADASMRDRILELQQACARPVTIVASTTDEAEAVRAVARARRNGQRVLRDVINLSAMSSARLYVVYVEVGPVLVPDAACSDLTPQAPPEEGVLR